MIYTNWILTIITIVFIPLMLKAVATIAKRSRRFFRAAAGSARGVKRLYRRDSNRTKGCKSILP